MEEFLLERLEKGKELENRLNNIQTAQELDALKNDYQIWDDFNIEYLTKIFVDQKISSKYKKPSPYLGSVNVPPDSPQGKINKIKFFLPLKNTQLESIINRLKLLEIRDSASHQVKSDMKKIFISHSSKDVDLVEKLIDLLESLGVNNKQIFCSSFEGYGVELGEDFLERIKKELNNKVLVLFVLSENFFQSPVCLCEMGATWVKTSKHIPVLIPPFDFSNIKGVIPNSQGLKITDKYKLNSLRSSIENFLDLARIDDNIWERKRDKVLVELDGLLSGNENESKKTKTH